MDGTGEPQFCGCLHDGTPPAVVRAVWIAWDWLAGLALLLNVAALARGFRDVLGAEPITFYEWPEPAPGTRDGGASSSGRLQQPASLRDRRRRVT